MFQARHAVRRLARPSTIRTVTRSLGSEAQAKAAGGERNAQGHPHQLLTAIGAFMGLALGGAGVALMEPQKTKTPGPVTPFERSSIPLEDTNTPPPRPELPTISLEDVAEHCDESSLWYT
jgi:hypothetical protein